MSREILICKELILLDIHRSRAAGFGVIMSRKIELGIKPAKIRQKPVRKKKSTVCVLGAL